MEAMKDSVCTAVVPINTAAADFFSNNFQVSGILSVKSDICICGDYLISVCEVLLK